MEDFTMFQMKFKFKSKKHSKSKRLKHREIRHLKNSWKCFKITLKVKWTHIPGQLIDQAREMLPIMMIRKGSSLGAIKTSVMTEARKMNLYKVSAGHPAKIQD
jgi:hypothetical protein